MKEESKGGRKGERKERQKRSEKRSKEIRFSTVDEKDLLKYFKQRCDMVRFFSSEKITMARV